MRLLRTIAVLSIMFIVASAVNAQEDIVDAHLKAIGGAENLAKIKTFQRAGVVRGTSAYGPLHGAFQETLDRSNNRGSTSMTLTGFSRTEAWVGKVGWSSDSQSGVRDLTKEESQVSRYILEPSPLATIHAEFGPAAFNLVGSKEFNGKTSTAVKVLGSQIVFYLNADTHLIDGVSFGPDVHVFYDGYKKIEGVQFARKRTLKLSTLQMTFVYEYKQANINIAIEGNTFKKPAKHTIPMITSEKAAIAGSARNDSATNRTTAIEIIASMDKNSDGRISKSEASEDLRLFFAEYDTNQDGAIEQKEAVVVAAFVNDQSPVTSDPEQTQGFTAKQIVDFMDKDGDGKINKDEANAQLKPNFRFVDTNNDGFIDLTEAKVLAEFANRQN